MNALDRIVALGSTAARARRRPIGQPRVAQRRGVGRAIGAASSSFASFDAGAAVPVLPFLLELDGGAPVAVAGVITGAALMLTGGIVAVLSGGPPLRRAMRQFTIGAIPTAVTFLLGLAFEKAIG
jgi:VIT1/CCC1 family predicted Fe2+/Mn2+ transporter